MIPWQAYVKAQISAGSVLPKSGTAFISVNQHDKKSIAKIAADLVGMGFNVIATARYGSGIAERGCPCVKPFYKVNEGRPAHRRLRQERQEWIF
jgi:carbamoyl-phosphate synthase large subunit